MFARLGKLIVSHPWRVIAVWVGAAVLLSGVAPGLKTTSDQSSFLPTDYESVKAQSLADRAFPESAGLSAGTVVSRIDHEPLNGMDRRRIQNLATSLDGARFAGVTAVSAPPQAVSRDGRVELIQVAFANNAAHTEMVDAVKGLRDRTETTLADSGLQAEMGGAPAQFTDLDEASSNAESIVALATIALIVILLLAIFRSPVAALVPILTVGIVATVGMALIGLLADGLGLKADASISSLLIIVLFGIGTDYTLFLLFRVRERLRAGEDPRSAVAQAVARVGVTVASSAIVVIAAILALTLSQLESNRALAPSLAIAVFVMLVAALTLVPAVLSLLGPRVFWPSHRWRENESERIAAGIARLIAGRPLATLGVSSVVLVGLAIVALGFKADYNTTGDLSSSSESAKAQATLTAAFPDLTTNPTSVLVSGGTPGQANDLAARLRSASGVAGVSKPETSSATDVRRLEVYLTGDSAFADSSLDTVDHQIRPIADSVGAGATALVGGPTSSYVDVRTAMNRDYRLIFPIAALVIAIVLAIVLRSLVAPWVLLGAVVLGFAATLGATVAIFQGLGGQPGVLFSLPLTMYVFVVAVGTDYNILIATRLREEQERAGYTPDGVERGTRASLPTIAAAAVILAGTFGSLGLTSLNSLRQLGFGVSVGILLSALVMASILVPSAAALLGRRFWWPGSRCAVTTWPHSEAGRPDTARGHEVRFRDATVPLASIGHSATDQLHAPTNGNGHSERLKESPSPIGVSDDQGGDRDAR